MRGKNDDSTTSECMRAYSIATESFNSYYKNYSDNFLPKAHKMYTAIENERKKLIEEALFKFPELFKAFNRNNENALQKQIVEKEESEESPTKTEKQSNKKDASTNDPFLYKLTEVLIDKDWHILQLKKKHNDIFDTTIECLLKFDQNKGKTVPIELTTVCEFVREHGKETEGIFRISALSKTTSRVKQLIKTKKYDLPEETDVHACACFIKQFLQQLPESVVNIRAAKKCYAIGEKHLNGANVDDCIKDFEQILKDIYPENIPTLEYVSKFLNEISLSKEKNRMNHENLGIIFAPTLLAMSEKTMEDISTKIRRGKFFMIFVIACANKIEWK
ncbi:Protein fam13a [Bonamia ostreae]|uniref:Protein fam13a n=1 Tax=Bonamia ostreae TaxID=126728 RepID=A0ABV2AK90_9EUKA